MDDDQAAPSRPEGAIEMPKTAEEWNSILVDHLVQNSAVTKWLSSDAGARFNSVLQKMWSDKAPVAENWLVQLILKFGDDARNERSADLQKCQTISEEQERLRRVCLEFDQKVAVSHSFTISETRMQFIEGLSAGFQIGASYGTLVSAKRAQMRQKIAAGRASAEARRRSAAEGWELYASGLMERINTADQAASQAKILQRVAREWDYNTFDIMSDKTLSKLLRRLTTEGRVVIKSRK